MNTTCFPSGLKLGDVVSKPVRPTNGFGTESSSDALARNKFAGETPPAGPPRVLSVLGVDGRDVEPALRRGEKSRTHGAQIYLSDSRPAIVRIDIDDRLSRRM